MCQQNFSVCDEGFNGKNLKWILKWRSTIGGPSNSRHILIFFVYNENNLEENVGLFRSSAVIKNEGE
jgi:hypothetical protein